MFSDKKYGTIIDKRKGQKPVDLQTLKDFSVNKGSKDLLMFEMVDNLGERKYSHDVPVRLNGDEQQGEGTSGDEQICIEFVESDEEEDDGSLGLSNHTPPKDI